MGVIQEDRARLDADAATPRRLLRQDVVMRQDAAMLPDADAAAHPRPQRPQHGAQRLGAALAPDVPPARARAPDGADAEAAQHDRVDLPVRRARDEADGPRSWPLRGRPSWLEDATAVRSSRARRRRTSSAIGSTQPEP